MFEVRSNARAEWSDGVLEWWSTGPDSENHHSNTPVLQYSNHLRLHYLTGGERL